MANSKSLSPGGEGWGDHTHSDASPSLLPPKHSRSVQLGVAVEPVSKAGASRDCCVPLLQQQRGPAVGRGTGGKHSKPGRYWSRGSPRAQSALLLRAWPPGPATLAALLSPAHCSWWQGPGGHAEPAEIAASGLWTRRPELFCRWTAHSLSSLSELGALASLVHSLLSNKLADSTSGHLYLGDQAQNFLRGRAEWVSGASVTSNTALTA